MARIDLGEQYSVLARAGMAPSTLATWESGLWREPRLLVPVDVQALVVTADTHEVWADVARRLPEGPQPPSGSAPQPQALAAPAPFTDLPIRPPGVYLHWALPDALASGTVPHEPGMAAGPTQLGLPPAPNRWLVARLGGGTPRRVTAWVVESDRGATIPLADWREQAAPPAGSRTPWLEPASLTAVSGGDPAWAAVLDGVVDRFAVHDDLAGLHAGDTVLTYVVAGWYSDAELDPLAGVDAAGGFETLMSRLRWSIDPEALRRARAEADAVRVSAEAARKRSAPRAPGSDLVASMKVGAVDTRVPVPTGAPPALVEKAVVTLAATTWSPRQTLCQGVVFGVRPDGAGTDTRPRQQDVSAALGSSTEESFAALLAASLPDPHGGERLTTAFLRGMAGRYDDPDGAVDVDEDLHGAEFVALPGGSRPQGDRIRSSSPADAIIQSLGRRSAERAESASAGVTQVKDTAAGSKATVGKGVHVLEAFEERRAASSATAAPPASGAAYRDVEVGLPRLHVPTDPVLTLVGVGRSLRHGRDGLYTADGTLSCRLTGEPVDAMRGVLDGADVVASLGHGGLPPECDALLAEAALTDAFQATQLAATAVARSGGPAKAVAARVEGEIVLAASATQGDAVGWAAAGSTLDGTLPSPRATTWWRQPWVPLYLEWEVALDLPDDDTGALAAWSLGEVDLEPDGAPAAPTSRLTLAGRSLLTPGPASAFADRVTATLAREAAATDGGELEPTTEAALRSLAARSARLDVLAAGLDALRMWLLGWDDNVARARGDGSPASPLPSRLPRLLRSGAFTLDRARVVDAFGRVLDLAPLLARTRIAASLTADGAGAAGAAGTFVPRITAPARLMLRLVDPGREDVEAYVDQETGSTSPVAGWLLSDAFDDAAEVFDAAGEPLGQLLHDPDGPGVIWESAPGRPGPLGAPPPAGGPADAPVAGFVTGLLRADADRRAAGPVAETDDLLDEEESPLSALLRVLDTTASTVDASASGNEHLAGIVGRPLALVRALLRVEIGPDPAPPRRRSHCSASARRRCGTPRGLPCQSGWSADEARRRTARLLRRRRLHPLLPGRRRRPDRRARLRPEARSVGDLGRSGQSGDAPNHLTLRRRRSRSPRSPRADCAADACRRSGHRGARHLRGAAADIGTTAARVDDGGAAAHRALVPHRPGARRPAHNPHAGARRRRRQAVLGPPRHAYDVARRPDRGRQHRRATARAARASAGRLDPPPTRPRGRQMTRGDQVAERGRWLRLHGPGNTGDAVRGGAGPAPDGLLAKDAPRPGADWVPLGPTQVTGGMAGGRPPVTGRVRGLAVGPGGLRAYAATANGGIWSTNDGGEHWVALDPWRDTPDPTVVAGGGGLAMGSIAVHFGATEDDDVVFAGCGEDLGWNGDGVRRYGTPGAGLRDWTLEATNVPQHTTWRVIVPPPGSPGGENRVWLASSAGLFERPAAAPFAVWPQVVLPAAFAGAVCDVALLVDGAAEFLYAAVLGVGVVRLPLTAGSAVGQPGTALTGLRDAMSAADAAQLSRISLAVPRDGARRVYALAVVERGTQRARLFRYAHAAAGVPRFRRVTGVPGSLWWSGGPFDQGRYDNTLAVVPQAVPPPGAPTDDVVIAGSFVLSEGEDQAGLYRGRVGGTAASPTLTATYAGRGAHPDVHCAVFAQRADGTLDADDLWIGTDGGVFRSRPTVEAGRFQSAHAGMGVLQVSYLADHPSVPAFLLAGSQDNGMLIHTGQVTWRRNEWAGDAGSVAVDPVNLRWMWQYIHGTLHADRPPARRVPAPPVRFPTTGNPDRLRAESDATNFYAPLRTVAVPGPPAFTRLAFGSQRVWTSDDWGVRWISWPSGTNPAAAAGGLNTNLLDGSSVVALAWAGPQVLLAATAHGVYRLHGIGVAPGAADVLARDANTARWGLKRPGEPANVVPPPFATAGGPADLPAGFLPNAVAPGDPAAASVYLGLASGGEPLWFLPAGAAHWVSCGLDAFLGGTTRVHAILVDPAHPLDVYVGTDVGVYRAVRNDGVVPPTWAWQDFSFGLPEASVTDLALFAPAGSPVRLLRAATYGRGVWELDLEKATGRDATAPRSPEVFIRVASTDDGRRLPSVTRLPDPLDPTLPTAVPPPAPAGIAASPDIAIVRGRARVVLPWPGSVTGAAHDADRRAWRIAANTWGHRLPIATAAFGAADRRAWQAIQRERQIPVSVDLNERTWRTTFAGLDVDPDHVRLATRYGRELAAPSGRQIADTGPNRVLVQVRARGPDGVEGIFVSIFLLWHPVAAVAPIPPLPPAPAPPHPGVTLPPLPDDWRSKVVLFDYAGLATDGWQVAGAQSYPSGDISPEVPSVVGIDLDLTARAAGDLIALVPIVLCIADQLPEVPANRDLATALVTENRIALRVVELHTPAT